MIEWRLKPQAQDKPDPGWAEELSISPLLLDIIWNRGFRTLAEIDRFLNAPLRSLTPPAAWPQINEAAELLVKTLLSGKKLAVWGDYDVDGITATALTLDVLEFHGYRVMHHLPDRRSEGYGVNVEHLEKLAQAGCEALLTVDCGISDNLAISRAKELGMTVIVSDHHLPPRELPPADAFVDPAMDVDKPWPYRGLAGVGVAFYLMGRVNQLLAPHTGRKYRMDKTLDLAGLGTMADVMPLSGENRILARGALHALQNPGRIGFAALKLVSGLELNGRINSGQAVFRLAPRINAAGRMGNPELALKLLRSQDFGEAEELAAVLDGQNSERKAEESRIFNEARKQALELMEGKALPGLVLYGADWHSGIIGIVASRIVEEFERPAIVMCAEGDLLKGSGRSWSDFDIHAGLNACASVLAGYGGHKMAAGLTMSPEKLPEFRRLFAEAVKAVLGLAPAPRILHLERELGFDEAQSPQFTQELELLQPFGPANPEPVFLSRPLVLKRRSPLGRSGEHVQLELEEEASGRKMTAKAWRMADYIPQSLVNHRIRVAFTPRLDSWNGFPSIDLGIKDWKNA